MPRFSKWGGTVGAENIGGVRMDVKEDYEKGYAKGRDYARHERERGMANTVFDAFFVDLRDPPMRGDAEKEG